MEPISYLEGRIAERQKRLQEVREVIQQKLGEQRVIEADLDGFQKALEAERRLNGIYGPPEPPTTLQIIVAEGSDTSKAEFARQYIRSRPQGTKPGQLMEGFREAGIPIKKPYIYALVQRLSKQQAIKQRRGKWYPVVAAEDHPTVNGTDGETLLP